MGCYAVSADKYLPTFRSQNETFKIYTAFTDWFLQQRFNPSKPIGYYVYRQFNIQQFYVLHTQCIYVFCVDLRKNSDYFPMHQ